MLHLKAVLGPVIPRNVAYQHLSAEGQTICIKLQQPNLFLTFLLFLA